MTNHFFGEAQGDEKEEDKRGCLGLASRETRVEHLNTCTKPHLLFVYNIKFRDFHLCFGFAQNQTPTATAQVNKLIDWCVKL